MRYEGDTPIYYHANSLGSVVALTDEDGELLETVEYDVYGASFITQHGSNPPTGNRFLFTGREWDTETGLYHYRARAYSPSLGRFLQRDLIGIWKDERNLGNGYIYVGNNPCVRYDWTGMRTYVTQDKGKEKKIEVRTKIIFYGLDKSVSRCNVIVSAIDIINDIGRFWDAEKWQWGCCPVEFFVEGDATQSNKQAAGWDSIALSMGTGRSEVSGPADQSVDYDQDHTGTWYKLQRDPIYSGLKPWEWVPAHEYGHLLGFLDTQFAKGVERGVTTGRIMDVFSSTGQHVVDQRIVGYFLLHVESKQGKFEPCEQKEEPAQGK